MGVLHALLLYFKTENLPGKYYQHSHFTNEETEKQALLKLQVGERCFLENVLIYT